MFYIFNRVVPLGKIASGYLENYIKGIRHQFYNADKTDHLFLSKKGNALSKNTVGEIISRYTAKAKINKPVTCHTFRHSCATHMVRNNANLRHVQEMLGHAQLTTTQKYIRLTINDLKEAHSKYHPREKNK